MDYVEDPLAPHFSAKRFLDTFDYDFDSDLPLPIVDPENPPTRIEKMFPKEEEHGLEFDGSELPAMVARERAVVIEDICKNDRLVLSKLIEKTSVFWMCAKDAYLALQVLRGVLPYGTVGTLDFARSYSSYLQEFIDFARRAIDIANKEIAPQDKVVLWLEMRLGLAEKLMREAGPTIEARSSWPLTEADDLDFTIATMIDLYLQNPELPPSIAEHVTVRAPRDEGAGRVDYQDYVSATEIRTTHTPDGIVLDHRNLMRFLEVHQDIRTARPLGKDGKPRPNRLLVHLADWHKNRKALAEWYESDSDAIETPSKEEVERRQTAVRSRKQHGK